MIHILSLPRSLYLLRDKHSKITTLLNIFFLRPFTFNFVQFKKKKNKQTTESSTKKSKIKLTAMAHFFCHFNCPETGIILYLALDGRSL